MKNLLLALINDPLIQICAFLLIVFYFGIIRKLKVVYKEDGIAIDPWTGRTWIYDWEKYFEDPVRKENLKKMSEALKKIPLGVPLDDNLQPINKKK